MTATGRLYIAKAFGWQGIVRAANARAALRDLKVLAAGASLLSSDITSCQKATVEEIEWHEVMSGSVV